MVDPTTHILNFTVSTPSPGSIDPIFNPDSVSNLFDTYTAWRTHPSREYPDSAQTRGKFCTVNMLSYSIFDPWGGVDMEGTLPPQDNLTERRKKAILKIPDLQFTDLPVKRRLAQPRFKLQYDTLHDINLRLANSIIYVGSTPVYIREIVEIADDFILITENEREKKEKFAYRKTAAVDLRSPEPQYLTLDGKPYYLVRPPLRQQIQGLTRRNSRICTVNNDNAFQWEDEYDMLWSLKNNRTTPWTEQYKDFLLTLRACNAVKLSATVAVYRKDDDLFIEYKNRPLGKLKDDCVFLDQRDISKRWIKQDLAYVNLRTVGVEDAR